jgi:hypothetical protein
MAWFSNTREEEEEEEDDDNDNNHHHNLLNNSIRYVTELILRFIIIVIFISLV